MDDNELMYFLEVCPSEIRKNFKVKNFKYGEKLLVQGKECDNVYILIDGKVKTYHSDFTGRNYLEDIDKFATIFWELEALINKEIVTTVEALANCKTIEVDKDIFIKWMELDSKFTLFISKLIAQRNYDACIRERTNAIYPLKYRVMYFILNTLYKNDLVITKDLIVEGVGSNIRSINRIINQLIEENILMYKSGIITIESMKELEDEINNYKKL